MAWETEAVCPRSRRTRPSNSVTRSLGTTADERQKRGRDSFCFVFLAVCFLVGGETYWVV